MLEKIKKMKLIDYWHFLILILCYIPSLVLKFIYPNIWIVSENGDDAKDNGFAFFKYMMTSHPEIKCYYIITKQAKDYKKVEKYSKNLLIHNSIKSIIYIMGCRNFVSSQLASSFPYSNIFFNLYMAHVFKFNYIFLQHGITKENVKCFYKNESNIDLFCCAANPEYDYVKEYFGYKDYEVSKLGFCRYDNLSSEFTNDDSILFMPTWRKYLEARDGVINSDIEKQFLSSKYYKTIYKLINDRRLIESLEKNNKILYFCLHDKAMIYKKYFTSPSKNIIIVDKSSSKTVDKLIRECKYLITDTSSVSFDFAYQKKRLLYYQFDYNDIIKGHWSKGYFNYDKDGFGKVVKNHNDCVNEIILAINEKFKNSKLYEQRTKNFYCFNDKNNCERTFNKIRELSDIKDVERKNRRIKNHKKNYLFVILVSLLIMLLGITFNQYILMLFATILLFFHNLYYGLLMPKKNIFFNLFHVSIFTFLLGKPIIQTLSSVKWWIKYSEYSEKMTLISIWLTLLGLFLGSFLNNNRKLNVDNKFILGKKYFNENIYYIRKYSFIMFMITILFRYVCEIEKYIFMYGKSYTEYYLSYYSSLPSVVNLIGGMAITFLVIYLVTLPNKKATIGVALIYLCSFIPNFLIGQRNPLILAALLFFSYYVVRDWYENSNKWVNVKERFLILLIIPVLIIGLDIYNYKRDNARLNGNMFESFVDFFYTQGISFDVLNIGYSNMDTIRSMNKNYVFGPIVDYYRDNTIAKKVFKLPGLGIGNNEVRALKGNSFTHILAYLSRSDYLQGHGYGSSYILELYCNYGFIGLFIFSILLGFLLVNIPIIIKSQSLLSIIVLQMCMTIYFLPRAETMSSIMFIFTPHFLGSLIVMWFIIYIKKNFEVLR